MEMLTAKSFPSINMDLKGISKETLQAHYKLYEGYVKKTNDLFGQLSELTADPAKANATYSPVRELKVELSFAIGGVKNHENYFAALGGDGGAPTGRLAQLMDRDFGSYDNWKADMKATAMAARGWAWLAYDSDHGTLFNYIGDSQNTFPIWNSIVVLALDVYEHAYWHDYLTERGTYIDDFFANLDWANSEHVLKANLGSGTE